jgi:hypothetical protein
MFYITYDPITGQIIGKNSQPEGGPKGVSFIEVEENTFGLIKENTNFINIESLTLETLPLKPSIYHYWTQTGWILNEEKQLLLETNNNRDLRNILLNELDAIIMNPFRWNALSAQEQTECGNYRQSLLDVPQQEGFPLNIIWPEKPTCLP